MKTGNIAAVLATASMVDSSIATNSSSSSAQLCQGVNNLEQGISYCREVKRITFQNVGSSGQYSAVTGMDQQTGNCTFASHSFSGPLGPIDEPVGRFMAAVNGARKLMSLTKFISISVITSLPWPVAPEAGCYLHSLRPWQRYAAGAEPQSD